MQMQKYKNVFLLLVVALLIATPLLLLPNAEFVGADDLAEDAIGEMSPGYEPWFESVWEPQSEVIESLLFAVQAAVGSLFIGYYIGYKRGKREITTK